MIVSDHLAADQLNCQLLEKQGEMIVSDHHFDLEISCIIILIIIISAWL